MKTVQISTTVTKELFEELQRESDTKQVPVSELLRQKLTGNKGDHSPEVLGLTSQVNQLEQQVRSLASAINHLVTLRENDPPLAEIIPALSGLARSQTATISQIEKAENSMHAMSGHISRLVDLLAEEKRHPFGFRREFFQAAIMSGYALAKGSFTHNPQAWEPIKEDTRLRAFPKQGDEI